MSQTSPETETLWSAIRQRDANINGAFSALNAIDAQLQEMRSLKGWRLNLIRENLEKAKTALRTPVDSFEFAQTGQEAREKEITRLATIAECAALCESVGNDEFTNVHRVMADRIRALSDSSTAQSTDPLYDSRNPNQGRSGGLYEPDTSPDRPDTRPDRGGAA